LDSGPDILIHSNGLVSAPNKATAEKGEEEEYSIIELDARTGEVKLVTEPVYVKEWGRQLVENEGRSVEVDKGPKSK